MRSTFLVATAAILLHTQAEAAQDEQIVNPRQSTELQSGKTYLERQYGLSSQEARRRIEQQAQIEALSTELADTYKSSFLGVDIQHEPVYQVTASFARGTLPSDVLAKVPASLRSVFKTRVSRFDAETIAGNLSRLTNVFRGENATIHFSYGSDRFVVTVPKYEQDNARRLIPADLQSVVDLQTGPPVARAQANATSSDWIYGGWNHYRLSGTDRLYCTFAFVARDSYGRPHAVTAGHCPPTRHNSQQPSGRTITFSAPASAYYRNGYDSSRQRSYDFALIPIPIVSSVPEVYFRNGVSGSYQYYDYAPADPNGPWVQRTVQWRNDYYYLPASGNIHITDVISNSSMYGTANPGHPNGVIRCKVGDTTGVTCGTIIASSANVTDTSGQTAYGVVRVGQTNQQVIAYGGDSGGAVITEPLWSYANNRYESTAAGVVMLASHEWVHPANTQPNDAKRPCDQYRDGGCEYYYMPIDRINDFAPAQVVLRNGATGTTSKTP